MKLKQLRKHNKSLSIMNHECNFSLEATYSGSHLDIYNTLLYSFSKLKTERFLSQMNKISIGHLSMRSYLPYSTLCLSLHRF
jgi:hypothetical protein